MSLNEQKQKFGDNYSSCNDKVKPKISKLSYTPTTQFMLCIFKIKSMLKQFTKRENFNLK